MTSPKTVCVNAEELRTTFEFVSFGAPLEHSAYICVDTGKIYCHSLSAGLEEEEDLPEDLETSDRYIAVPHKNDLGLGRRLALAFVAQELSDEYDTVAGFFGRRAAYGHFKALLHAAACWSNGTHSKTVRWKRPSSFGAKRTAFSLLMGSHERFLGLAPNARLAAVQVFALPMPNPRLNQSTDWPPPGPLSVQFFTNRPVTPICRHARR